MLGVLNIGCLVVTFSMSCLCATFVAAGKFVSLDLWGLVMGNCDPGAPISPKNAPDNAVKYARGGMVFFAFVGVAVMAIKDDWVTDVNNTALTPLMAAGLTAPVILMEFFSGASLGYCLFHSQMTCATGMRPWAFALPVWICGAYGILVAFDQELAAFDGDLKVCYVTYRARPLFK